jgi:ankyrin repeat protein
VKHNKGDFVMSILKKLKEDPLLTDIERQFFINHQNTNGNTAIHEAALRDRQTISDILEKHGIELGLDLTLRNKKGLTIEEIRRNKKKEK